MNYEQLKDYLFSKSDEKFADFSKTLSNSDYKVIGVKNPILRQIIKEHIKDAELKPEEFELGEYLEIDFIYFGLSLSRIKKVEEQLEFVKKNIHKAKSWAITDTVTTFIRKYGFEQYWKLFLSLYKSQEIYDRRMAYVLGLKHYKDEQILKLLEFLSLNDEHMVMMAEAWLLATITICYPEEIYKILEKSHDISLKKKTISKIVESYRISDDWKAKFKGLR